MLGPLRPLLAAVATLLSALISTGVPAAAAPPAPSPAPAALTRAFELELGRLAREEDFSGVVLLAQGERVLLERAHGWAHRGLAVANRRDTKFNLGSINKLFTSLAVMRLVEAGRLSLDEPFIRWWPDYPQRAVAERVTVRQLLAHRSGLGNFWARHAEVAKDRLRTPADYLPLFVGDALAFEPDSRFAYSSNAYIVLGRLIEIVTGEPYHEHVRRTIFQPLGMNDTDSWALDEVVPNLSVGHVRSPDRPGRWLNNLHASEFRGSPAGGGFSTARDLFRFGRAMLRGRLLQPASMKLWTTAASPSGGSGFALGVMVQGEGRERIFGHSGGHVGVASELLVFENLDMIAVIVTNGDVDAYRAARSRLMRWLVGGDAQSVRFERTRAVIETALARGTEAAVELAAGLRRQGPISESDIDLAAGKWLHRGRERAALALARLNTALFEESGDAWLRLARVQHAFGQVDPAQQSYERYLTIEPEDSDARAALARLRAASGREGRSDPGR